MPKQSGVGYGEAWRSTHTLSPAINNSGRSVRYFEEASHRMNCPRVETDGGTSTASFFCLPKSSSTPPLQNRQCMSLGKAVYGVRDNGRPFHTTAAAKSTRCTGEGCESHLSSTVTSMMLATENSSNNNRTNPIARKI